MEQERPNYYAIIPAEVRYDKDLRANEKLLFGEITALSNTTGMCTASNTYFSKLYNVVPSAISKWIKDLENKKYISVEYIKEGKEIKQRNIRITGIHKYDEVFTKVIEGYSQKNNGGYSQKLKENNTSNINNTSINNKEIYKEKNKAMIENTIRYLNEKTGKNYKPTTPNTIKHLTARIKEGYTDWDFMDVIDTKCKEWLGTDMEKYLRPETLFGSKFENYINQ